jgi:hypothetical protein
MEFPGGRVPFTHAPHFVGGVFDAGAPKIPCYRTLDGTGKHIDGAHVPHELPQELATQLYTAMAKLQVMDTICYDAQRQVRRGVRVRAAVQSHKKAHCAAMPGHACAHTTHRERGCNVLLQQRHTDASHALPPAVWTRPARRGASRST